MASEIRVNTINNRSGLGTISITNTGAVFSGVTTFAQIQTTSGEITVGTGASVFSPATNVLALGTNNTEKVRITSTGRVGIGTDDPTRNVHISGTTTNILRLENTNANVAGIELKGSTGQSFIFHNSDDLRFLPGGTEQFRITSGGNVAVNDTGNAGYTSFSPCIALGDSGDSKPALVIRGSATSVGDISFCDNSGTESEDGVSEGLIRYDHNTDHMEFHTADSERLRINSSGNVGIGTDNPQKKFVVSDGAQGVEISPAESGISRLLSYNRNTSAYTSLQIEGYDINFIRDGGINAAKITSGGSVGIGTDNPQATLDVWGNVSITNQDGGIAFSDPDNKVEYHNLYMSSSDNSLNLNTYDGSWQKRLTIETGGNIGIGTDNPGANIHLYDSSQPKIRLDRSDLPRNNFIAAYNADELVLAADHDNAGGASSIRFFVDGGEKVKINDSGNIVIMTSGSGIDFSQTANGSGTTTSELLDDYEEGSFTVTLNSHSDRTNISTTDTTNNYTAYYTKVGRLVTVMITCDNLHTVARNHVLRYFSGLPFTSSSSNNSTSAIGYQRGLHFVYSSDTETTNNHHLYGYIGGNVTTLSLGASKGSSPYSGWPATHDSTSSQYLRITIQYYV